MNILQNRVIRTFIGMMALWQISTIAQTDKTKPIMERIIRHQVVQKAFEMIQNDQTRCIAEQITITQIPAPPFKEEKRAAYMHQQFLQLGLTNVRIDSIGNVLGELQGQGKAKKAKLVIAAHLDTVFPEGTDVTVKEEKGKLYAPGIGDDCRGLAALLSLIRCCKSLSVPLVHDVVFVANVGEEGLGDLRGVKYLFRTTKDIDGFISIDGAEPEMLVYEATGSRRFEISFRGPGGHSWSAFGAPSAVHALGRAVALIGDIQTPDHPKTTFTVGTIKGGTSVNTIAPAASFMIDMRSNDPKSLQALEKQVFTVCDKAVVLENERWKSKSISVTYKLLGDRPAGTQNPQSPMVNVARQSALVLGISVTGESASSTDANYPLSLGIPAITLGGGGSSGDAHTIEEWFDSAQAYIGVQRLFLTVTMLVGLETVTEPFLVPLKRTK